MGEKNLSQYILNENLNLDKIVDDYTPYIRKIIQNMVGENLEKEDKEEILQDTFFVLWKRYNQNYQINNLDSYLAGIARNLVKEKLRKTKKNVNIDSIENLIEFASVDTYEQERDSIEKIYSKIKQLKNIDIQIVTEFYYSEKSIKDIAKELHMSETNVKTRLYRARKIIKKEIEKEGK